MASKTRVFRVEVLAEDVSCEVLVKDLHAAGYIVESVLDIDVVSVTPRPDRDYDPLGR